MASAEWKKSQGKSQPKVIYHSNSPPPRESANLNKVLSFVCSI